MRLPLIHVFYVSLIAVITFGFLYLPLQDYPNLLYQGFVFNEYFFHGNTFNGFFHVYHYIPPNAVSTVILGLFDVILNPIIEGKIYLFLLAVGLYSALYRYLAFHIQEKKAAFAAVAFFLACNLHFLTGYLNFLTGLAIAVHAIVFIRQQRYETNFLVIGLSILLIYLCHFAALSLFCIYFLIYFILNKNYRGLLRFILSGIPTLIVFIQYLAARSIPATSHLYDDYQNFFHFIRSKFLLFFFPVIPFHDFKLIHEFSPILKTIDYLFSAVVFAFIIYIVAKKFYQKTFSLEFWIAFVFLLLAFLLPPYLGGVILPGERFVVFSLLNIFIVFYREKINPSIRRITFGIFFLLTIFTASYLLWNTSAFNVIVENNHIPPDNLLHSEQGGTNGFLHFHYYENIKLKTASPFFKTGLFSYPDSIKE